MHSSISHYALEAGSARLARKMDMYIASKMAELRDTGTGTQLRCGYYSRVEFIREQHIDCAIERISSSHTNLGKTEMCNTHTQS